MTVVADIRTGGGHAIDHVQRFTPLAGDGVQVDESVTIPAALTDLARVGTVLETVAGFEDLTWYGSGPHETYPGPQGVRPHRALDRHRRRATSSRTYARRRPAAGRTPAGSPWATGRARGSGSSSTSDARYR